MSPAASSSESYKRLALELSSYEDDQRVVKRQRTADNVYGLSNTTPSSASSAVYKPVECAQNFFRDYPGGVHRFALDVHLRMYFSLHVEGLDEEFESEVADRCKSRLYGFVTRTTETTELAAYFNKSSDLNKLVEASQSFMKAQMVQENKKSDNLLKKYCKVYEQAINGLVLSFQNLNRTIFDGLATSGLSTDVKSLVTVYVFEPLHILEPSNEAEPIFEQDQNYLDALLQGAQDRATTLTKITKERLESEEGINHFLAKRIQAISRLHFEIISLNFLIFGYGGSPLLGNEPIEGRMKVVTHDMDNKEFSEKQALQTIIKMAQNPFLPVDHLTWNLTLEEVKKIEDEKGNNKTQP